MALFANPKLAHSLRNSLHHWVEELSQLLLSHCFIILTVAIHTYLLLSLYPVVPEDLLDFLTLLLQVGLLDEVHQKIIHIFTEQILVLGKEDSLLLNGELHQLLRSFLSIEVTVEPLLSEFHGQFFQLLRVHHELDVALGEADFTQMVEQGLFSLFHLLLGLRAEHRQLQLLLFMLVDLVNNHHIQNGVMELALPQWPPMPGRLLLVLAEQFPSDFLGDESKGLLIELLCNVVQVSGGDFIELFFEDANVTV